MAKKKYYSSGKNFNPGVFSFGNAGMSQEAFRKPFPMAPRYGGASMDDSINQLDFQMREDMKPLRKGKQRTKF